jgi:gamma-glutamyl hydrolase
MIGIITAPNFKQDIHCGKSYMYDVYIKWIEMSGENAILIPYTIEKNKLIQLLNRVNGVVWVGGYIEDRTIHTTAQYNKLIDTLFYTYQHVINENNKGNYYPLWGICLGFEILVMFVKKQEQLEKSVISNSKQGVYPCLFTKEKSRLKDWFSPYMISQMKHYNCVYHSHNNGVDTVPLEQVRIVCKTKSYIEAIEFIDYPIYGTLFHLEQPKTELGIKIAYQFSLFLKNECSKNKNIWKWKLSDFNIHKLTIKN